MEIHTGEANISRKAGRPRRRKRTLVGNAVRLRSTHVETIEDGGTTTLDLRYVASGIRLTLQWTETGELLITGGPEPTTVTLTRIRAGRRKSQVAFVCPECSAVRLHLFLAPSRSRFSCRKCAGLVYRTQPGPPNVDRLENQWLQIGAYIERLRWLDRLGEDPEIDDPNKFARYIRDQLRELKTQVAAATPTAAEAL